MILTTITGREIKISSNQSQRTFTIRTNGSKYRTYPFNKKEFNECENMTGNDWAYFLRACDSDYYRVN